MQEDDVSATRVLPETLDETHDDRHPEMTYRLMGATWQGGPLFGQLPWRTILEAVEGIAEACCERDDNHALVLHLFCTNGKHRSFADAILVGRVLHLLGAVVTMMVCDGDDDTRPPRLCRLRRCACNCGPYPTGWEVVTGTTRYLLEVARVPTPLDHVSQALRRLAEASASPSSSA